MNNPISNSCGKCTECKCKVTVPVQESVPEVPLALPLEEIVNNLIEQPMSN